MRNEAGTTTRRRYQIWLRNGRPTSRKAMLMTVSWPASTPRLKERSAVRNSERGRPSCERTPAKPRPCSRPKAKTRAIRDGYSSGVRMFSTATKTIDSAISGSTIDGGSDTTP